MMNKKKKSSAPHSLIDSCTSSSSTAGRSSAARKPLLPAPACMLLLPCPSKKGFVFPVSGCVPVGSQTAARSCATSDWRPIQENLPRLKLQRRHTLARSFPRTHRGRPLLSSKGWQRARFIIMAASLDVSYAHQEASQHQRHILICVGKKRSDDTLLMWRWVRAYFLQPSDRVSILHAVAADAGACVICLELRSREKTASPCCCLRSVECPRMSTMPGQLTHHPRVYMQQATGCPTTSDTKSRRSLQSGCRRKCGRILWCGHPHLLVALSADVRSWSWPLYHAADSYKKRKTHGCIFA